MQLISRIFAAASAATFCVALPVHAEVQDLVVPAENDWAHQWTTMEFPASIGDFKRKRVIQFEERQTNVAANYNDPETETILTLYIYRPALPDASIWFDRALVGIGAHGILGKVDLDDMTVGSFAPSGRTAPSGQYAAIKVEGDFRSTGVAIYRSGEWLVKMRISSRKLNVRKLNELMASTLAQIPPLANVTDTPAYIVSPCETAMQFGEAAALKPDDSMGVALWLALGVSSIAAPGDGVAAGEESSTPTYCREGRRQKRGNIYRLDASETEYVIAMGDAGFSVKVSPQTILGETMTVEGSDAPTYLVQSATGLQADVHTAFSGMPSPKQALKAAFEEPVLASTNRPLGNENAEIQISSGSKDERVSD